jgi:tetratricopeptide (TPR) repeat protein
VPAQFIADDDQLQSGITLVAGEFILQYRKRLDQPMHILVRANPAGIEHVRIVQLIAFQDRLAVFAAGRLGKTLIEGVVDHRDSLRIEIEDIDQIVARGIGNGDDAAGRLHRALRAQVDLVPLEAREIFERKLHVNAVVNGNHALAGRQKKAFMMRNMHDIQVLLAQLQGQGEMFAPAFGRNIPRKVREVGPEGSEFLEVAARPQQEVLVPGVHCGKVAHEVPDVGSHTKLINSPDVDCNAHESSGWNYNETHMSRTFRAIFVVLTVIAAIASSPAALSAQTTTVLVNAFENQTSDRNLDWIGEGLAVLIGERLTSEARLYVFSRDERMAEYDRLSIPDSVSVSRATAMRLAWDMGADVIVTGRISGTHDDFRIEAKILDLGEGGRDASATASGKLDDVISLAASLSSQLAKAVVPGSALPESDYVSRPPIPRSAFEAYIRGLLASDPQRRTELLKDAVRLHPQYTAAIYQLGQAYYLDSNYKSSTELLEKVAREAPEYTQARFMLAMNHYHVGDFTKAADIFSSLPARYDVLVNLGAALAGKGDAAGAEAAWRRALTLNAAGMEASFNLAYLPFSRGEMEPAVRSLTQFLRSNVRDAEALFLQGQAYERLGRTADSQRVISQAIRLSPRLEKWVGQPIPNLARLRAQFNPTELRLPVGVTIWNEPRLSRKKESQDASDLLNGRRR